MYIPIHNFRTFIYIVIQQEYPLTMITSKSVMSLAIFACLLLTPTAGHSVGGAGVLEAGSLCSTLVSEMAVLASSKEDCRPMPVPVPRTSDKVNGEIKCMFQPRQMI